MRKSRDVIKQAAILAAVSLLPVSHAQALETAIAYEGRMIRTDSADDFSSLPLKGKRYAAPFFIESAAGRKDRHNEVMKMLSGHNDPVLDAYRDAASEIFFSGAADSIKAAALRKKALQSSVDPYRSVLLYMSGVLSDANHPAEHADRIRNMKESCRIEELASACSLAENYENIIKKFNLTKLNKDDYRSVMASLRGYVSGIGTNPPFFLKSASPLLPVLYSMGLPLEAAILAERMTYRDASSPAALVRSAIPFQLASAGDFRAAVRYSDRFAGGDEDALYLNTRIDWMILGGMYREAIELITSESQKLLSPALQNHTDYWTGFRHSPGSNSLKAAILFYLAGDVRQAAGLLEKLREIPGVNEEGEPYRLYAELRLAQILASENPELAHKIAEDIIYAAQAKGWDHLEYQATVLDAWTLYFQNKHYQALINLVKAPGIMRNRKTEPGWDYSHKLALLAVQNALRPKADQTELIRSIASMLLDRPYHEALFAAKYFLPSAVNRDFFASQALQHYSNTGRAWEGLSFITGFEDENRLFFPSGENPGSCKGLYTSLHWTAELRNFSTFAYFSRRLGLAGPARAADTFRSVYGLRNGGVRGRNLRKGSLYIFTFRLNREVHVYLVYPQVAGKGKRTSVLAAIRTAKLSEDRFSQLIKECPADRPLVSETKCWNLAEELASLRNIVRKKRSFVIHTPYNAHAGINWGAVLGAPGSVHDTVYFTRNIRYSGKKTGVFPSVRTADQCPSFQPDAVPVIQIWPQGLDAAEGRSGPRPVYLRHFLCGPEKIRFWDLDRFSENRPAGVIYAARRNEERLNAAFADHFTDTVLAEFSRTPDAKQLDFFIARLRAQWSHGVPRAFMRAAFQTEREFPDISVRIILPGFAE